MSGIFPETYNGALPIRDAEGNPIPQPSVLNGYVAPAPFAVSCQYTALPADCTARLSPMQINAFQGEMLCLAVAFNESGSWNCDSVCNLSTMFKQWAANNTSAAAIAAKLCADEDARNDFLSCSVSSEVDNIIEVVNGQLYARAITGGDIISLVCGSSAIRSQLADCLISTEAGNTIQQGSDGGLYVDALTASDMATLLCADPDAKEDLAGCLISDASDNALVLNGGELYVPSTGIALTTQQITTTNLPASVQTFRTTGYATPGDGGDVTVRRVAAVPSHPGYRTSPNGTIWEFVINGVIRAPQFGVGIGAGPHDAQTTQLFTFAAGREVTFPVATYNYTAGYTAPVGSCAFFEGGPNTGLVFSIKGLRRRYNNRRTGVKGATYDLSRPRLGSIIEVSDDLPLDQWQRQWSVNSTYNQWSDYEFGVHREFSTNSDASPNGWPQASIVGSAVSKAGNKDFPAGMHMLGFAMGNGGSVWGWNSIVSNNPDVQAPGGTPRFLCGGEIDMQPSQGSNLTGTSGAGLLVNSFWTPVPFAGIAIVGDAGGAWKEGIYMGGIQTTGTMFLAAGGSACATGIDLSAATFTASSIAVGPNAPIRTKRSGGAEGFILVGDNSGNAFMRMFNVGASFKFQPSNDGQNAEVFSIQTPTAGLQGFVARVANGAAPNTAAAALWLRANSDTSRSLNAGGTVNVSGADYAEYELKKNPEEIFEKGEIVGFDENGLLTKVFSESISFAIKSTSPNIVGGDDWHQHLGTPPVAPDFDAKVVWEGGERPPFSKLKTLEQNDIDQQEWDVAYAQWQKEAEDEYNNWRSTEYAAYESAQKAYDDKLNAERVKWDRIAYCGKVPLNAPSAPAGYYVIPVATNDDRIDVQFVSEQDLTFAQMKKSIGRVRKTLEDGRPEIAVGC